MNEQGNTQHAIEQERAFAGKAMVAQELAVIGHKHDGGVRRQALLCELIQEMHEIYKGTYIVVTHDIASARRIGEYIALLWRGRIVEAGNAERMFSSDNAFVRQFLSGSAEGPLTMD
jgi:phospholipid/cholesterol/gamma-HCH transport system ATP-binding protein